MSGVAVAVLAGLGYVLAIAVDKVKEAAERSQCNLGHLRAGLLNYHEAHGGLPPAVLYDKNKKPLHSWRVLVLPYIEESKLYEEFRLDEPWNSPHNLALLPRMPKGYAGPGRKAALLPPYHTALHVFLGRGTAFEERPKRKALSSTIDPLKEAVGLKVPDDFPDGPEDTLLFVEAGEPVPWTKPLELAYEPDGPLPELRGLFRHGFRACTVHGPYRFVRHDTDEATLRALITRNGGEKVDASSLK